MPLHLGCPIWSFKGWVGNFYPDGTKSGDYLREYARRLTAIEGNTTFYAIPAQKTIDSWVAQTPATFRFLPKVPREVSHEMNLVDQADRAAVFIDAMSNLRERLGPMFLQLPPRYSPRMLADLTTFLQAWPKEIRLGVEVRHLDWFESPHSETLNALLAAREMARVVIDTRPIRSLDGDAILDGSVYQALLTARERKPDVPILPDVTTDFVFIRYIGHPRLEMNVPFLDEWAGFLAEQLGRGVSAYVACHSPENLTAPWICRELHRRISRLTSVPPLPWDSVDSDTFEQAAMF